MYTIFLVLHSTLRYIILLLLLISIAKSFLGWFGKKPYTKTDKKYALFSMFALHLQLLLGLTLYFISPKVQAGLADFKSAMKDTELRFWTVEHVAMMFIGIIIVTLGVSLSKRATLDINKHKRVAIWFTLGLLIILSSIPWPFSKVPRPWF